MKQRIVFIDLAKGICMSFVVYSHEFYGQSSDIHGISEF